MNKQRGFTLLELIVALVIITGIYAVASDAFGPALAFRADIETGDRQKNVRKAIYAAYKINALNVDANAAAVLDFGTTNGVTYGTINPALPGANGRCTATAATFATIASFSTASPGDLFRDGYGNPFCVYITPRNSLTVSGNTVNYHSVAIVSGGRNGVVDAGTGLDPVTGSLTIAGDDRGILLDGRAFAQDRYDETFAALKKAADIYQAYFSVRYQSDPSRSISVDYFSCGAASCPPASPVAGWDAGNAMPSTCSGAIPMYSATGTSPNTVLGLSQSDVTDGYGNIIMLDNCGASVRSPGNATATMQAPPYTAVISTTLPGGATLAQTAIGQF